MICRGLVFSLLLLSLLCGLSAPVRAEQPEQPWSAAVYGAFLTGNSLEEIGSMTAEYENSATLLVLALARHYASLNEDLIFEWEGQFAQHMGDQKHQEINALTTARWRSFPWNERLSTSAAFGIGLSWASEVPELEKENHNEATDLLVYLLFEVEMAPSSWGDYSLVIRTHHRSGAFGLFDGVHGASNAVGLGVKYRF